MQLQGSFGKSPRRDGKRHHAVEYRGQKHRKRSKILCDPRKPMALWVDTIDQAYHSGLQHFHNHDQQNDRTKHADLEWRFTQPERQGNAHGKRYRFDPEGFCVRSNVFQAVHGGKPSCLEAWKAPQGCFVHTHQLLRINAVPRSLRIAMASRSAQQLRDLHWPGPRTYGSDAQALPRLWSEWSGLPGRGCDISDPRSTPA